MNKSNPRNRRPATIGYIISIVVGIGGAIALTLLLSRFVITEEMKLALQPEKTHTEMIAEIENLKEEMEAKTEKIKTLEVLPAKAARLENEIERLQKSLVAGIGRGEKVYTGVHPKTGEKMIAVIPLHLKDEKIEISSKHLKKYKPKDLKLVGILKFKGSRKALIEDQTGNGFLVSESTLIGENWKIKKITDDEVKISKLGEEEITITLKMEKD